jgi:hypothetical protein
MRYLILAGALLLAAACARVESPPGGPRDTEAPRVIETFPAPNATAADYAGTHQPVRIVFHETLSERSPRELAMVSPETGEVHAERDGEEVRVTIDGGWQPNRVYRVTVMPGIVDRFGNARSIPYELVFSTGAPIVPNALGGLATDRITGRPVANARVEAILATDSTRYTTVTDSTGFFALRALPAGTYATRVYADQNRNRKLDAAELRDQREVTIGEQDTLTVELSLLGTDTTPARLLRADIRDSAQVRLFFDDYTAANAQLTAIGVRVWLLPDSTLHPGGRLMTARAFQALRADSTRRPTPPGIVEPDTARALPMNELVWVPAVPLQPQARYRFTVNDYRNIHGIARGGGSAVATAPSRVRTPPPVRGDSAVVRPDSTGVPRDTIRL